MSIEPWVSVPGKTEPVFMVARGVEPVFFEVADTLRIASGTAELRGNRVLLGRGAQQKLGGLGEGDALTMFGEPWRVVGTFETGGTNLEFEIVADLGDLMRAGKRDEYSAFTVKLDDPANAERVIALVEGDRRVLLGAAREKDFYAASGRTFAVVAQLGLMIAIIVTIGAVFGGMNTMYAAVSGRMREVGVLRALGFSRRSILASFVSESLLLSVAGGVLGSLIGAFANGFRVSVMTANIRFSVGPGVVLSGLLLSAVLGLLGGYLPAREASRKPVVEAMRQA
jgi:ABC-type antimicrobial peptide transport system permease subunit